MPFVHEFLFKAAADSTTAWHVVLASVDKNGFGEDALSLKGPMTPEQAETLGFPLSTILTEINGKIMEELASLKASFAELKGGASIVADQNGALQTQLQMANDTIAKQATELAALKT